MQIELLKEECTLINELVKQAVDDAENQIAMFDKDANNEDVTTALMVRAFAKTIQKKMENAITA
jgi:hypothetical protein